MEDVVNKCLSSAFDTKFAKGIHAAIAPLLEVIPINQMKINLSDKLDDIINKLVEKEKVIGNLPSRLMAQSGEIIELKTRVPKSELSVAELKEENF